MGTQPPDLFRFYKRTHLKDTVSAIATTSPKPALNIFLAARNNAGAADQFFKKRLRFASVGQALTSEETTDYYQLIQSLQDALGRAV